MVYGDGSDSGWECREAVCVECMAEDDADRGRLSVQRFVYAGLYVDVAHTDVCRCWGME